MVGSRPRPTAGPSARRARCIQSEAGLAPSDSPAALSFYSGRNLEYPGVNKKQGGQSPTL
jgi:hypothetical protein